MRQNRSRFKESGGGGRGVHGPGRAVRALPGIQRTGSGGKI